MKLIQFFGLSIISLFFFSTTVRAVEFKTGDSVTIAKDQAINGSLFVSGSSVVMDGVVHGDLYCAGQSVTVTGTVDGDVLCAGQTIRIEGVVDGDARMAGQMMTISGLIKRNVNALAQSLTVDATGTVMGELLYGAQNASLAGTAGSVTGASENTTLAGLVHGNVLLESQNVAVENGAKIQGTLTYASEKETVVAPSATVSGAISYKKTQKQPVKTEVAAKSWPQNSLPSVFIYTLLGILIAALFSRAIVKIQKNLKDMGLVSGAVGLVALVSAPLLFFVLLVSIVGILAIPFLLLAYVAATIFGRIAVGMLLGRGILDGCNVKQKDNLFLQVLVGIPILWIMCKAPFIGGFLALVSIFWGLGGVLLSLRRNKK